MAGIAPWMMSSRVLAAFLSAANLFAFPFQVAAMDSSTSTFDGEVPQTCSFSNFSQSAELTYQGSDNSLRVNPELPFSVTTNASSIRLGVSAITPVQEVGSGDNLPMPVGGIIDNEAGRFIGAYHYRDASRTYESVAAQPGVPKAFRYRFGVYTSQRDGDNNFLLLPGTYVYQVTFTCYMS